MNIAVLGTGIVGKTIAEALNKLGHSVIIGTRSVEAKLNETSDKGSFSDWLKEHPAIALATFEDACKSSELLVNCTPGMQSVNIISGINTSFLSGKVLVDIANPLDFSNGMPPILTPGNTDSLGEQLQRTFPELRVVKTLNTMNCFIMVHPERVPGEHHVFLCGNDAAAKTETRSLLSGFGWKETSMIDLGDISNARGTEQLLPIWIRLWQALGTADFNFHIQKA